MKPDCTIEELNGRYSKALDLLSAQQKEIRALRSHLSELVEAVTAEVNEKGAGGYLLARLADAKGFLKI